MERVLEPYLPFLDNDPSNQPAKNLVNPFPLPFLGQYRTIHVRLTCASWEGSQVVVSSITERCTDIQSLSWPL